MSEAEIPLDLSFVLELAKPPSLEEELQLEKEIRTIRSTDDIEGEITSNDKKIMKNIKSKVNQKKAYGKM